MGERSGYPTMPIKVKPYQHQADAFKLACKFFSLTEETMDDDSEVLHVRIIDSKETEPRVETHNCFCIKACEDAYKRRGTEVPCTDGSL